MNNQAPSRRALPIIQFLFNRLGASPGPPLCPTTRHRESPRITRPREREKEREREGHRRRFGLAIKGEWSEETTNRQKERERERERKKSTWLLLPADKEAALSLFPASDRARIYPREKKLIITVVGSIRATWTRATVEQHAGGSTRRGIWLSSRGATARAPGHTS